MRNYCHISSDWLWQEVRKILHTMFDQQLADGYLPSKHAGLKVQGRNHKLLLTALYPSETQRLMALKSQNQLFLKRTTVYRREEKGKD